MSVFKRKDSPYWWVIIRDLPELGKPMQQSTKFPNLPRFKKDAQYFEDTLRADYLRGKLFEKPSNITIRNLFEEYLPFYKTQASFPTKRSTAKVICTFMGNDRAAFVTPKRIQEFQLWRKERGIHELTINRDLDTLSHLYSWAIKSKIYKLKENPVNGVEQFNEKIYARDRRLTSQEVEALLRALSPRLRLIVVFDLSTGLRKGEILSLRWSTNIDMERRLIKLYRNKEGRPKFLPMHGDAYEVLKMVPRRSDWVFSNDDGSKLKHEGVIRTEFNRIKKKLGLKNLRFHDLRHTFGSDITEDARDLKATSILLGHSNTRTTDRYAHLADTHLKTQVESKRSYLSYVSATFTEKKFEVS